MPKYYCDYCDTYLTHDSPSVRKTHNTGRKHRDVVRMYYERWLQEQTGMKPPGPIPGFPLPRMNQGRTLMPTPPSGVPGGPFNFPGMPPQMSGPPRFPPPPGGMMPPPGAFPPGNTSGSPSEAMQNKK